MRVVYCPSMSLADRASYGLVRAPEGYFSIAPLPSREELRAHYNDKYYGPSAKGGQYSYRYTEEELAHKALAAEEAERCAPADGRRLLEIGVGEGFLLKYFALVVCNNVLEHVLDPPGLLERLRRLLSPAGIVRVAVPNDGSWLQHEVVRRGQAEPGFWLAPPEHLHYFTSESLARLFQRCGFHVHDVLGDFPIDLFLLNPDSNYARERQRGRHCHFARVAFELGLRRQSLDQLIAFRRGCAAAGIGQNVVLYAGVAAKAEEAPDAA